MRIILFTTFLFTSLYWYAPQTTAANVSLTVCEYVAADDKKRFRSFLKTNRLKIRKIFKAIKCNDQNILVFSASSKSMNVGKLIIGKLSKKLITTNLPEIEKHFPELAALAKKRVE